MSALKDRLTPDTLASFGREIDAIRDEVMASRGSSDARYIKNIIRTQRILAVAGRAAIFTCLIFLPDAYVGIPSWPAFWALIACGTASLGIAKILENMELGHNIMHGQWDWMRDPDIQSSTWEWDNVCPAEQWKHSHNIVHHTWTNVIGKDNDIGYGVMRVFAEQKWHPYFLTQPLSNLMIALFFEWGVAVHDLEVYKILLGKKSLRETMPLARQILRKVLPQVSKDYLVYPLLAGPFFMPVLAANIIANLIRNLWTYMIIFCGHFPAGSNVFTAADVQGETRAQWYLRQLLGSCNIRGGKLFHILSGNLSYQIEHHLFPDMPSNRYQEVSPRVRAVAARYGLPYNSGSLIRQFGTTQLRILRQSWPSKPVNEDPGTTKPNHGLDAAS